MEFLFKLKARSINKSANETNAHRIMLHCYDVTSQAMHFDPHWLSVIQDAPAWMSRAERLMMFTLAFSLRPRRYIEIGTLQGGSALLVCSALDALESDAKMYLVDPAPKITPENKERLRHRATLYEGHSPEILKVVAGEAGGSFDLVLIDGDHSYKGVMRDAEGILPYVEPGGYIVFHDSFYEDVRRAIDDFVARHSGRVLDLGILTREFTSQKANNKIVKWGGLRLVQVIS
jgi:predicted O-methyltransferase YrrM